MNKVMFHLRHIREKPDNNVSFYYNSVEGGARVDEQVASLGLSGGVPSTHTAGECLCEGSIDAEA